MLNSVAGLLEAADGALEKIREALADDFAYDADVAAHAARNAIKEGIGKL